MTCVLALLIVAVFCWRLFLGIRRIERAIRDDDQTLRGLLVVGVLLAGIACGPIRPSMIPPKAILTAEEEDQLLADDPDPVVYVMGPGIKSEVGFVRFSCFSKPDGTRPCKPLTVLMVLAQAGQFSEWAKLSSITVVRDVGTKEWKGYVPFDFKRFLKRQPAQDFRLRPNDIILVP